MRTDRKSRRFRDAMGNFVFIRKPKVIPDWVGRVHVRSYRAHEKMPEGFSMGMTADIKN